MRDCDDPLRLRYETLNVNLLKAVAPKKNFTTADGTFLDYNRRVVRPLHAGPHFVSVTVQHPFVMPIVVNLIKEVAELPPVW